MKRVFRRPSPAMVVAIAALIVALGGTAVAGGVLNKKKVNKIITNRAPGLSVASAKTADSANTANNANNANSLGGAPAGDFTKANQFAYGEISDTGAVKSSPPNRNIVSVSNPSTGVYCMQLAFNPTWGEGGATGASSPGTTAQVDIPATNCPAGTEATVYVLNATGTFLDDDFTVILGSF